MIVSHQVDGQGLTIRTDRGLLSVVPYTPRTVRIRYTLEADLSTKPSLTVVADAASAGVIPFRVEDRAEGLIIATDALCIEIDRWTCAFTYRDAAGELLTREPARGGKTLEPVEVMVSVFDEASTVESLDNVDGVRIDAVNVRQVADRGAYHTKLEFEFAAGEALYGLGSHEEGMFNLRGQHQYLYQQNLKAVVPVLVSTRGYGVFVDCTSLMTFHDDAFGSYLWADVDEELDYYFVLGPEFDEIVAELRRLTGRAGCPSTASSSTGSPGSATCGGRSRSTRSGSRTRTACPWSCTRSAYG